jgi:class 3 adenylate cyclase
MSALGINPVVVVREPGRVPLVLVLRERTEIGRECAGLLLDDSEISRRHLELRPVDGEVVVTDLGSTNGTLIDGRPLTGSVTLAAGSLVTLGSTTIALVAPAREHHPRATSIAVDGGHEPDFQSDIRRTSVELVADSVAQSRPQLGYATDQGTLTIVFSDIEGSTARSQQLGDEGWYRVLSAHNDIVRRHVRQYGGREVKSEGDGFMLTFPSARRAVRCMTAVQATLAEHGRDDPDSAVLIRVGIHTGEAITDADGDLFGTHVVLAARIANEAAGGEVLVSALVREIIAPRREFGFGEAREAELKGLEGRHLMYPILLNES